MARPHPSRSTAGTTLLLACAAAAAALPASTAGLTHARWSRQLGLGGVVPHVGRSNSSSAPPRPSTATCNLQWFDQVADHFSFADGATFKQRYYVCEPPGAPAWRPNQTILFYTGNEASVEIYVNSTGFAWENAAQLGARIVFFEHRFYGESHIPGGGDARGGDLHLLTMEQALADYARAIYTLKRQWDSTGSAVIALGGSYGGMLSAWLRMKYPAAVQGAIAGSAPILAFDGLGQFPGLGGFQWDSNAYWRVVTRDATPAAGAVEGCDAGVREAFKLIFELAQTPAGRAQLTAAFSLCLDTPVKNNSTDALRLATFVLNAWDTFAMGNFPYPSDYLVFQQTQLTNVTLPAFPFRVACEAVMQQQPPHAQQQQHTQQHTQQPQRTQQRGGAVAVAPSGEQLLRNMKEAVGILYNVTKTEPCFELPTDLEEDGIWDYQFCTEMLPQETYFTMTGTSDMFWNQPMSQDFVDAHCSAKYNGTTPRADWIALEFGGAAGASNTVFSNGFFDPWSAGGVAFNDSAAGVWAITIPNGAHHLDLMFSDPRDPPDVVAAREFEVEQIKVWVRDYHRSSSRRRAAAGEQV